MNELCPYPQHGGSSYMIKFNVLLERELLPQYGTFAASDQGGSPGLSCIELHKLTCMHNDPFNPFLCVFRDMEVLPLHIHA